MKCHGDINAIDVVQDIPNHDILCAGFPCQPFSKAGKQQGFNDEKERGNLFYKIMEVLRNHQPEYVILENVANLKSHDNGRTYEIIYELLSVLYDVRDAIFSPHFLGIPQHRKRIYIVGRSKSKGGLKGFSFPDDTKRPNCDIQSIIIENDTDYMSLRDMTRTHLEAWENFLKLMTANKVLLPTFPIWAMEFGADYDYEKAAPYYQQLGQLRGKKGRFGIPLKGNSKDDLLRDLPVYAQGKPKGKSRQFPDWKKQFIAQNRKFYEDNKEWIDQWISQIQQPGFENSHQKF